MHQLSALCWSVCAPHDAIFRRPQNLGQRCSLSIKASYYSPPPLGHACLKLLTNQTIILRHQTKKESFFSNNKLLRSCCICYGTVSPQSEELHCCQDNDTLNIYVHIAYSFKQIIPSKMSCNSEKFLEIESKVIKLPLSALFVVL